MTYVDHGLYTAGLDVTRTHFPLGIRSDQFRSALVLVLPSSAQDWPPAQARQVVSTSSKPFYRDPASPHALQEKGHLGV